MAFPPHLYMPALWGMQKVESVKILTLEELHGFSRSSDILQDFLFTREDDRTASRESDGLGEAGPVLSSWGCRPINARQTD